MVLVRPLCPALDPLVQSIDKLEASGEPLNDWGTGTHYMRRGLENWVVQCKEESVSGLIAAF